MKLDFRSFFCFSLLFTPNKSYFLYYIYLLLHQLFLLVFDIMKKICFFFIDLNDSFKFENCQKYVALILRTSIEDFEVAKKSHSPALVYKRPIIKIIIYAPSSFFRKQKKFIFISERIFINIFPALITVR